MTTPSTTRTWIGEATVTGDASELHARFAFEGRQTDPAWQGAFARTLDGSLQGLAGRWRFDRQSVVVTNLQSVHAVAVADRVAAAVDAANAYLERVTAAADDEREAQRQRVVRLASEAITAQAAIRHQLALRDESEQRLSDTADASLWDWESPSPTLSTVAGHVSDD
jgi:hypothetical protein